MENESKREESEKKFPLVGLKKKTIRWKKEKRRKKKRKEKKGEKKKGEKERK